MEYRIQALIDRGLLGPKYLLEWKAITDQNVLKYFDLKLKDSNKGWHKEWFLIANQKPELLPYLGYAPVTMPEWLNQPTSIEMVQLLKDIANLKGHGLTTGAVSINFHRRLTQPIKDRVHPAYEYSGSLEPTREAHQKEVAGRVCEFVGGVIKNKHYPKAYSLVRLADPWPKLYPSTEADKPPAALVWELDSFDGSDEDVPVQGSGMEVGSAAPIGWWMRQAMQKVMESKVLEAEKKKRKKKASAKTEALAAAFASAAKASSGVVNDDSDLPSPTMKKKKAELLETIVTDMEKVKEQLKMEIRGGEQKETAEDTRDLAELKQASNKNLAERTHNRADAIYRAEEYRLEAERLEVELRKAKEDAIEQIRQKDQEIADQK
ncbi:LOW QUALITY PROTEIN: hypothetical protein SETIT_2G172600v2 [Setaria italica]|uniref:Uncharacterized protein n=1 Tax=Setaria italica TaxID=4555 RepID=A0A368PZU2_SETIT|nr:LOW QUALITY PROTEIN: hypothetical protein SETIT_2G172600v2 [Setaria italica]